MQKININEAKYSGYMSEIEIGLENVKKGEYIDLTSDISSILTLHNTLNEITNTVQNYNSFVVADTGKFRQAGNDIVEQDQNIASSYSGPIL